MTIGDTEHTALILKLMLAQRHHRHVKSREGRRKEGKYKNNKLEMGSLERIGTRDKWAQGVTKEPLGHQLLELITGDIFQNALIATILLVSYYGFKML